MEFLQQNKLFVIIAGAALVALVILWPSLFGLGPTVVSLDSRRYERAMMDERSLQPKMDQFFPKTGKGVPIKRAVQDIEACNRLLNANLDEMRAWTVTVPRFPFRIPEARKDAERKSYVSLAYTYARTGQLRCDEYSIDDNNDGLVFITGIRNVPLRDPYFGTLEMYTPQAIEDPETRIAQIALIHELGHLAVRLNVDEITSIAFAKPYPVRLGDTDVALAFPLTVRLRCDLPTLLAFLHALDGAHGHAVVKAGSAEEEPADAIKPIPTEPKPTPGAADEPEDPGPGAGALPGPAPGRDAAQQKLQIRLIGSPSYLSPDSNPGGLKEHFTLFRRDPANSQKFLFVANAIATKVLDPGTPKLVPESILNWRALCARLASQGNARGASVGKRLWQLLSPAAQQAIGAIANGKDPDDALKTDVVASLNDVLISRRDFYRDEEFASVPLADEAVGLLKLNRQTLAPEKLQKLNRLLLQAACPEEVARMTILLEAAVEAGSNRSVQPDGKITLNAVRDRDFASTRYLYVRNLKVNSVPGKIASGTDGFPSEVTPPHLEVELQVAAVNFLEAKAVQAQEKRPAAADAPVIHRGF